MADVYASTGRPAWVSLPLRLEDRLLGSLTASWAAPQTFLPDEVDLMTAFAAQCAQALDRLRVREAEQRAAAASRRLSEALQRSLLTAPPEPDHLQIAVRYQPAAREAQVGGDWYDAFLVPDGTTTLVVGDVTGHDRNAAAAMGQLRNVLRGVAQSVVRAAGRGAVGARRGAAQPRRRRARHRRAGPGAPGRGAAAVRPADAVVVQRRAPAAAAAARRTARAELLAREPDLLLGLQPDTPRTDHARRARRPAPPCCSTPTGWSSGAASRSTTGSSGCAAPREAHAALPAEELCDALLAELAVDPEDDVALLVLRLFPEDRPRPAEAGPEVLPDAPGARL